MPCALYKAKFNKSIIWNKFLSYINILLCFIIFNFHGFIFYFICFFTLINLKKLNKAKIENFVFKQIQSNSPNPYFWWFHGKMEKIALNEVIDLHHLYYFVKRNFKIQIKITSKINYWLIIFLQNNICDIIP